MIFDNIEKKIENREVKIGFIGLGRIGLPTALMFTKGKYHVVGVDISKPLLQDLQNKKTFIDEPGLEALLIDAVDGGYIEFTTDTSYAVKKCDVIVVCVPTPVTSEKVPDFSAIESVAKQIGLALTPGKIIINESSVSPTTIERLIIPTLEKESNLKVNVDFGVCSCPERADPGKIVDNFDTVARIIGGSSDEVGKLVVKLYSTITHAKLFQVSTPGTANAVKLTENIFRDVNIALMNEFAILYERLGIDVKEVIQGAATKYNFQPHFPGPGVGGPCLPANAYYIIKDAVDVDYIPFMVRVSREINDRMPNYVTELISNSLNFVGKSVKNSVVAMFGISYKANVRDIQISPAMKVIKYLQQQQADLKVWDPYYMGEKVNNFKVEKTLEEAVKDADCIVVLTDHKEFYQLNFSEIQKITKKNVVLVDTRNIYQLDKLSKGLIYCGVGRKIRKIE
jgi:nucleotide sugar dehydrogenase